MIHARQFDPLYIPVGGEGGASFGVLPFSVPVVGLLSLLVIEVCDSLLGNPSYMKEKWQVNNVKYRRIFSVTFFYISWVYVVLCEGRI